MSTSTRPCLQVDNIIEEEPYMTVGPATNALSQLTRMSSARSGRMLSSRRLSMASRYSGRFGKLQQFSTVNCQHAELMPCLTDWHACIVICVLTSSQLALLLFVAVKA